MSEYILSCESTVDLNPAIFKEYDLNVICFHYYLDGVEHVDDFGQSLPLSEFYNKMVQGAMTKTSQINVEEFINYFEPFLKQGKDILHLCLSSGISGVLNSANTAKQILEDKYPDRKIIVVDSLAASSGFGLLVVKLANLKKQGYSIDELANYAINHRLEVNHWFFSSDLTFFVRGGRISKAAGFFGTALKICPLLNVSNEGKLIPREKIRTKKKAIQACANKMFELANNGINYDEDCYISHSNCYEDAYEVKKLIEEHFPKLKDRVKIFDIGTTIGSHTGPGTVALFFFGKAREN